MVSEEKEDELVTRSSAMVIHWLKHNLREELKAALKEIYWSLWWDLFSYLYRANWFRLLAGLLTLASAVSIWIKDHK